MNPSTYKKEIEKNFETYEALQSRHLEIIKTKELPDLKAMTLERKQASDQLQASLNRFMENAGSIKNSLSSLSRYESRLNAIMALDERIASEIEKHRDWLKNQLNRMKQGKNAMRGYKSAGTAGKGPRVFNISR
ncbi:MAG: hypothetical protein MI863_07860 [Desulfobacterales bacterium]|nr:hypothetical protein [Desulfobacterales bacterium]